MHYQDYVQCLNTKFRAMISENSIMELELVEVTDKSTSERQEQFVLTFMAPPDAPTIQSMYQIQHEKLGDGLIFLVPIARDEESVTYEAVFNRMKGKK